MFLPGKQPLTGDRFGTNERGDRHGKAYSAVMDKKEINSPKLTARFVVWMCVGCLLLLLFLAHYMWKVI